MATKQIASIVDKTLHTVIHLTPYYHCLLTDWNLPISSTTLQTFPTFGGSAVSTPLSLADTKTAPIPAVLQVPTASSIYPQELPPKLVRKILNLEFIEMTELVPNAWRAE